MKPRNAIGRGCTWAFLFFASTTAQAALVLHSSMDNDDVSDGGGGDTSVAPFTVFDTAGSAENGTASGSPNAVTSGSSGILGEALSFEGTSGGREVDYGNVHNHVANSGYTVSAWFNPDDVAGGTAAQFIARKGNGGSSTDGWSMFVQTDGDLILRGAHGGASERAVLVNTGAIADDTWYHASIVIDDDNNVFVAYLDGVGSGAVADSPGGGWTLGSSNDSTGFSDGDTFDTSDPIELGNRPSFPFEGQIDDFAIWDRALSAAEVGALNNLALEPDLQYDAGTVDLLLEAFINSTPQVAIDGLTWRLVDDGSLPGSGGDLIDLGPLGFRLNLGGGNGFTTFVPEPSASGLFVFGFAGLAVLRRRRTQRKPS